MASRKIQDDTDSSSSDPLEEEESDGYEDVESDQEDVEIVGLLDNEIYPNAKAMIAACKDKFGFDFIGTQKSLGLDFYESIKFVNYIRGEVKKGNQKPDVSSKSLFESDEFLQSTLENDALLFSLDDLSTTDGTEDVQTEPLPQGDLDSASKDDLLARVQQLEGALKLREAEFNDYKSMVHKTLDQRWSVDVPVQPEASQNAEETKNEKEDKGYFASYSHNDIHETMLKDTVRTNAYRDFIYNFKHLFEGKVVLDIGCGSGILSLFCAKAGAAKVIAVDNSNIIEKTRLVVHANGYSDKITCVRGKIEEVTLPVSRVDIIVSEWMGYALLYEAMLDSVLWARDRYLKPEGLMVPSHCTLHIAPVVSDVVQKDKADFWENVYDFDMRPMIDDDEKMRLSVQTVYHEPKEVGGPSAEFLVLPLHTITTAELSFLRDFTVTTHKDIESLGGWLIWFDTFFLPSRTSELPPNSRASSWSHEGIAFTTGPDGPKTHWECAFMSTRADKHAHMNKGIKIVGAVEYKKQHAGSRGLDIRIRWDAEGSEEKMEKVWGMGIDE